MASTVAQPLERQFGQIAGVTQMTSTSTLGATSITLQFDLNRNIDAAAQDVQAAITAAGRQLPTDLPSPPTYRKVNPADSPILVMGVHSDTLPLTDGRRLRRHDPRPADLADLRRGAGVDRRRAEARRPRPGRPGQARHQGPDARGHSRRARHRHDQCRQGHDQRRHQSFTISANDQLTKAAEYNDVIVAYRNGAPVRVSDVGQAVDGPENLYTAAWDNRQAGGAADRLQAARRQRHRDGRSHQGGAAAAAGGHPAPHHRSTSCRTAPRPSAPRSQDVEFTLGLTIALVVLVIFLFLRNVRVTIIPSLVVPLSLLGAPAVMYLFGFSLDNLSLMALTISVGFVVDDAIVVVENIYRHIEDGMKPLRGRLAGLARDRLHRAVDQRLAGRGVHSAAADGRHRRPAVPRVRHHGDGGDRRLGLRVADADADAVRALPAPRAERHGRIYRAIERGVRLHARLLPAHASMSCCATSS